MFVFWEGNDYNFESLSLFLQEIAFCHEILVYKFYWYCPQIIPPKILVFFRKDLDLFSLNKYISKTSFSLLLFTSLPFRHSIDSDQRRNASDFWLQKKNIHTFQIPRKIAKCGKEKEFFISSLLGIIWNQHSRFLRNLRKRTPLNLFDKILWLTFFYSISFHFKFQSFSYYKKKLCIYVIFSESSGTIWFRKLSLSKNLFSIEFEPSQFWEESCMKTQINFQT